MLLRGGTGVKMRTSTRARITAVLFLLLTGCRPAPENPATSSPGPDVVPRPSTLEFAWGDRAVFREGLAPSQQTVLDRLPGASVYHIRLSIEDDLARVTGLEEVLYTNQETTPLEEIDFRLYPNALGGEMKVGSIRVDGVAVEAADSTEPSLLRVPLSQPLQPGARVVVQLEFDTRVPPDVETNYGVLSSASGVLAYAHGYPMVAVYDDRGWDREVPPPYGDVVYADASFYLVSIDAPARLVLAASGREIAREARDGRQVVTFAAGPARDFYLAASPNYVVEKLMAGRVTVSAYADRSQTERAMTALDVAVKALGDFGDRYGAYPYTDLKIVSTPNQALGIEYPGVFALTDRLLTETDDFQGTPESILLESTVAHEIGHQWFYNLVGSDQVREPWLDESLTQFVMLQYYADEYGDQGARGIQQSFYARWDRVNRENIPIGKPVAAYSAVEYGAIVYGRGALLFAALQQKMGEQAFEAFLKDYVAGYSWAVASTDGLRRAAEKRCACDLAAEFKEWVYAG